MQGLCGTNFQGNGYPKLKQVIAVTICDFTMFRDFEQYLSCHEFRETQTNNSYLADIKHFFIELPKFGLSDDDIETVIEKWCYFLKHAGDLEVIPAKLDVEPFRRAFKLANRMNMTKDEWEFYDAVSVRMQDERGGITAAHASGKTEGLKEGKEKGNLEGKREILIALKNSGLNHEQIAGMTGMEKIEVERLLGENAKANNK